MSGEINNEPDPKPANFWIVYGCSLGLVAALLSGSWLLMQLNSQKKESAVSPTKLVYQTGHGDEAGHGDQTEFHEHLHVHSVGLNHQHFHPGQMAITHSHRHSHGHTHDRATPPESNGQLILIGHRHATEDDRSATVFYYGDVWREGKQIKLKIFSEASGKVDRINGLPDQLVGEIFAETKSLASVLFRRESELYTAQLPSTLSIIITPTILITDLPIEGSVFSIKFELLDRRSGRGD